MAKTNRILSKRRLKMDYPLYLMMALPVIVLFIYHYIPMFGVVIAFVDYKPAKGVFDSTWLGFKNFSILYTMPGFFQALRNTVIIAFWKIVMNIIIPVSFTILLNEILSSKIKRIIQTMIYLPHFISWVLLAGIFRKLLSGTGIVNSFLGIFGIEPIIFLGDNRYFRFTVILTYIWKEFGYGTIVYLAAIAGVNVDLYEAAQIDGAGHFKQMIYVTLPAMVNVLNAGFDQIYNLYNDIVYETGDILDTLVYRMAFGNSQFGISMAASLFKSIVSCIFVVASYKIAYVTSGYRVF